MQSWKSYFPLCILMERRCDNNPVVPQHPLYQKSLLFMRQISDETSDFSVGFRLIRLEINQSLVFLLFSVQFAKFLLGRYQLRLDPGPILRGGIHPLFAIRTCSFTETFR